MVDRLYKRRKDTMDKKYKIMNRDQIKYLAIILMTFNHIAHILLPSGTVIYEVFEDMGYFTSITMCSSAPSIFLPLTLAFR